MGSGYPEYGIVIAATLIAALSIPVMQVVFLRLVKNSAKAISSMFGCFFVSLIVWFAVFVILKGDRPHVLSEYLSGLAIQGFLWLGYMEVIFQLYRGFSHTIVTDITRSGPVSLADIRSGFAEGIGENGMLQRRLSTMHRGGLIEIRDDLLTLTPRGRRTGVIAIFFNAFLKIGSGG